MSSATKSRSPKQRFFSILFDIEGTTYKVFPLPCDPSVGSKAFRFAKQGGDGEVYDLYADANGVHCQCKGHLRWGTPCKHIKTLQAAGKIFDMTAEPAQVADETTPF